MSYRFMRVIVFFDLPSVTDSDKREYRNFRNHLIKSGFIMMQESVYSKIALNATNVKSITEAIRQNKPPKGIVQLMVVTERQYTTIEYIVGDINTNIINSDERLIIL